MVFEMRVPTKEEHVYEAFLRSIKIPKGFTKEIHSAIVRDRGKAIELGIGKDMGFFAPWYVRVRILFEACPQVIAVQINPLRIDFCNLPKTVSGAVAPTEYPLAKPDVRTTVEDLVRELLVNNLK